MRRHLFFTLGLVTAACGAPEEELVEGKAESPERIDTENDPNRFQLDLSRALSALPATGESIRKPFPSNWWPMSQGGVARRWNGGQPGPAEKYDLLVSPDKIKDVQLTLAQKNYKDEPVNQGAQPETFRIGPAAEWEHRNHGRYGTKEPEGWYGHCNGWSSYVLNEDEPKRPVSVRYDATSRTVTECASAGDAGCVRFEVGDLNALGAELYWNDGARMVGRRCEQAESEFTFDESGRVNAVECRDGNAATMHIVATNMLGRLRRPFVVDLTADRQVWNFPVYKYQIDENREVTVQEALRLVGAPANVTTWTYNTAAVKWVKVKTRLWIVEDSIGPTTQPAGQLLDTYTTIESYDYILELDAQGNIIGGEYTGASKTRHPDFLWYSFSNSAYAASSDDLLDGDNKELRYSVWKQILTLSQRDQTVPVGGPAPLIVTASPGLAIPDNNPTGVSSTLEVTDTFAAARVRVKVEITHTYRGDLKVTLDKGGKSAVLHNNAGGNAANLSLDMDLADFAGTDVRGTWRLTVADTASTDTGTLVRWSLELYRPAGTGGTGTGGTPRSFSATPNLAIPDNNQTGISSTINVAESFELSKVRVTVDIAHTYIGDLVVSLTHGGQTVVLHNNAGGGTDNLRTSFDAAITGNATGAWVLSVKDTASTDTGTLASWKLDLTPTGGSTGGTAVTKEYPVTVNSAIPDNNRTGLVSTVAVNDALRIASVKVEVAIAHPYVGDLTVTLEKDGMVQTLHDKQGGSADDIRRTFDTLAFVNASARGTWTLKVVDGAAQDVGKLERWKLIVNGTPQ